MLGEGPIESRGRMAKLVHETGRWGSPMKRLLPIICALSALAVSTSAQAQSEAQSKADHCAAYARDAAASSSTSTGPARGAARGAIGGAIFGNAGAGAAAGAVIGTARRANQKSKSYQFYYDQCMAR